MSNSIAKKGDIAGRKIFELQTSCGTICLMPSLPLLTFENPETGEHSHLVRCLTADDLEQNENSVSWLKHQKPSEQMSYTERICNGIKVLVERLQKEHLILLLEFGMLKSRIEATGEPCHLIRCMTLDDLEDFRQKYCD